MYQVKRLVKLVDSGRRMMSDVMMGQGIRTLWLVAGGDDGESLELKFVAMIYAQG